jgi:hypothetical protein
MEKLVTSRNFAGPRQRKVADRNLSAESQIAQELFSLPEMVSMSVRLRNCTQFICVKFEVSSECG